MWFDWLFGWKITSLLKLNISGFKEAEPGHDDILFNDNIHGKLGLMLRE